MCGRILEWQSVAYHFLGYCVREFDLWPSFKKNRARSISLILLEVGIPNLVCGCILG